MGEDANRFHRRAIDDDLRRAGITGAGKIKNQPRQISAQRKYLRLAAALEDNADHIPAILQTLVRHLFQHGGARFHGQDG